MDQYNEGTKKLLKKDYHGALKLLLRACKNNPTKESYLNLGACYKGLDNFPAAIKAFHASINIDASYALAYNNLGLVYHVLQQEDKAEPLFRRAIALDSSYTDAVWNLSLCLLKQACSGDYAKFKEGWDLYEIRFTKTTTPVNFPHCLGSRWRGESDSRILVVLEQGLGDAIMFARYLPLVGKDRVTILTTPDAAQLFEGWDVVYNSFEGNYKYWVPIGSLPMYFSGIPAPTSYIEPPACKLNGGIGIVWKGNPNHANDKHRSHSVKEFERFCSLGSIYSLQFKTPAPKWAIKLDINDLNDTMSYIAGLDLIITVDTSVAHLAAAMGKQVWNIIPNIDTDFRWGCHGDTSIWYPTMKIFRSINDAYDFAERCPDIFYNRLSAA